MKRLLVATLGVVGMLAASSTLWAGTITDWHSFIIRNSSSGGIAPGISDVGTSKLFQISLAGQKAGWGTNGANGVNVGSILSVGITRDLATAGWGPYMNVWVTDGVGGYAVLSNEPSHTAEWAGSSPYNTTWSVLKNATTWVYEVSGTQGFKLPNGTTIHSSISAGTTAPHFTFGDFADYLIAPPTSPWGGNGAPDDLNASVYTAYGFNWVFGDTQSNYLNGYLVSDPTLTIPTAAVPEPATWTLLIFAGLGLAAFARRRGN